MNKRRISSSDIEYLSAYLDGTMSPRQKAAFEARLRKQAALRTDLEELQKTRHLLRTLPRLRTPHNLTLSPQTAGKVMPTRLPALFGAVSAMSSALLIFMVIASMMLGNNVRTTTSTEESQVSTVVVEAEAPEEEMAVSMAQEVPAPTEALLGGAIAPGEETSRNAEPTIEAALLPPSAEMASPEATPSLGIQGDYEFTPTPYATLPLSPTPTPPFRSSPTPIPTEEALPEAPAADLGGEVLPVGASPKVLEPTTIPPTTPFSTALFISELILAMIAGCAGITALVLMIRFRR